MHIDKIHIENFGMINNFKAEFDGGLNVIRSQFWLDIFAVLGIISCSHVVGFNFTRFVFTPNTHVYAALGGNFGSADMELFYDENCAHGCGLNIIINGKRAGGEELSASIDSIFERDECAVYINGHDYRRYVPFSEYDFTHKIKRYLQCPTPRGNKDNDIIGSSQFNEVLQDFISSFRPVKINSTKDILASITQDGILVPLWRGEVRQDLSASEWEIFNYISFVEVNRFWGQVADKFAFKEQLPLYIGDFTHFIDEAADISRLIKKTMDLGRQTFLFYHDGCAVHSRGL